MGWGMGQLLRGRGGNGDRGCGDGVGIGSVHGDGRGWGPVCVPLQTSTLKALLIRSGAQRNVAYTFMLTFPTDLPSQIFHLFSN